ncbi:hypothetical protein CW751_12885 [Brumimicrobium salinarum]|uniref:Magnesium transporter MgtE intracellular domain-containing protein n=1 Tax=Brumimicrobium salinarum TaxID=2058658 RepID=A0A2I0QZV4_9FLAO|nr:CBS domain-containing protein [Brumimicrobium salinarum]PKR79847.1 hypothetical protein CW751_12885 [Brumimicrobium salinarum]
MDRRKEKLRKDVLALLNSKQWKALKLRVKNVEAFDLAELFEDLLTRDKIVVFRLLNNEKTKSVFKLLSLEHQHEIIEGLAENAHKIAQLLNDIQPDDRTAFLSELPSEIAQQLIQHLSLGQRKITNQLLGYPKDSIGRLMTTAYVAVRPNFTVDDTFKHIRRYGQNSETINVIYVVDEQWRLIDDLKIKSLLLADPQKQIAELIDDNFIALNAKEDQEVAIKVFKDYDRVALPVIGDDGVLIGIVT